MSSGGDQVVDAVVSTVGLWWPDAEEGELRDAAAAWDRMADALDAAGRAGGGAAAVALAHWDGDGAATAFRDHWDHLDRDGLRTTAEGCRTLAAALREYADEVESAKHEIEILAVEVGASLALGAAMAFFTFGTTAAAAAGVAARLVALAAQIGIRVSASVAGIVSTTLTGATFGAVDGLASDAAGQVFRVEALDEGGYSPEELSTSAAWGAGGGAVLGGAGGVWATRALRDARPTPELLRAPGGGIRAALEPADWGPLHGRWAPGLHSGNARLRAHELPTLRHLADNGANVRVRPEVTVVRGRKNPDAIVRTGPRDPGTYVEMKTVSDTANSVSRRMRDAIKQLEEVGGGHVVLDGRASGLTFTTAEEGWETALRNLARSGREAPASVDVILGDGTVLTFPRAG